MRKLGETRPAQPVRGLDGVARSKEDEAALNSVVFHTFSTPVGRQCLAYLRSITTDVVLDSQQPDHVLRYLEGMRCVVKLIQDRVNAMENP